MRQIGAAIGIVMAWTSVNEETAFKMLAKASQDQNRKLRQLASELVRTTFRPHLHARM